MSARVAVVTGASSGIGEVTARTLAAHGYTVYGAARRLDRLEQLRDAGIRPLGMDVTDEASMAAGIEQVVAESGRIDVLVNNAGYGSYGALEDVPLDEARRQMDVNVFGAARLMQLVLPHMRAQGAGTIVNISSMGGKIHTPLGSWYHATKYALEALSDCLRLEVEPFGIHVVLVEPGGIRTEWGGIAADQLESVSSTGPYSGQAQKVAKTLRGESAANRGSDPQVVADAVLAACQAEKPKTRYAIGFGAKPLIAAKAVLPDRVYDGVIRMAMGMPRRGM